MQTLPVSVFLCKKLTLRLCILTSHLKLSTQEAKLQHAEERLGDPKHLELLQFKRPTTPPFPAQAL